MNGIMGMNELLLRTTLTPSQHRMAEAVRYSADALLTIINDILDLSKLEAGRFDLEAIDFDLHHVVNRIADIVTPQAETRRLVFKLDASILGSGWFRGDPGRVRQILLNLLGNALKFTDGGEIVLAVANVENRAGRLRFEVRDTGIGISAEASQRLFRPFEQEDSSIARRFGGTGLGLSICKYLVEQMQGEIGVVNRAGGGSIFWFEIELPAGTPVLHATSAAATEPLGAEAATPKAHILLAEDNPVNVMFASLVLESLGYTCEIATNGMEAVAAARRGGFDLILMDMQMPKLDGLSATREIRRDPGQSGRVPIIAMTANAMKADEMRCLEAGMDDYISKPIDLRRLSGLVATWLGRSRP